MKFEVEMSSSSFCLMNTKNNMHQSKKHFKKEKDDVASDDDIRGEGEEESTTVTTVVKSFDVAIAARYREKRHDTTKRNGDDDWLWSCFEFVEHRSDERKYSNRRRSDIYTNNIALNEEIQKQTNSKEEKDVLIKPNIMPSIAPAQPSALLSKLSAFLPQMHEANLQLEEKIQKNPILAKREIEIDAVLDEEADDATDDAEEEEEGKPQIEMSLGMGVVDLKTAEVVEEVEKLVGGFANNEWNSKSEKTNDDAEGEEDENIEKAHKKKKKKKIEVL